MFATHKGKPRHVAEIGAFTIRSIPFTQSGITPGLRPKSEPLGRVPRCLARNGCSWPLLGGAVGMLILQHCVSEVGLEVVTSLLHLLTLGQECAF